MTPTTTALPGSFVDSLALAPAGEGLFEGRCEPASPTRGFGGHSMALGLHAAQAKVAGDRPVHTLQMRFVRPVVPLAPLVMQVLDDGDSRSFSRRRVVGRQQGKEVFTLTASFILPDAAGLSFQQTLPAVPVPDALKEERIGRVALRHVEGDAVWRGQLADPSRQRLWNRLAEPLPDDPAVHACALLYLSDTTQLWLTMAVHGLDLAVKGRTLASLEHSMWFHRPLKADAWSLYDQCCPSTSQGTGLVMGELYGEDGTLAATVVQTGILRPQSS